MRIYTFFIIIVSFLFCIPVNSNGAIPDKKKSDETPQVKVPVYPEGVVYSLPRSGFIIQVNAQKTIFKPGPYYQYAQKYLGITNADGVEKVTWTITGIKIDQFSEADPETMFKVSDTLAMPVSLLSDGVIANLNGEGTESCSQLKGSDFITKGNLTENPFTDLSSDNFYNILVDSESGTESMVLKSTEDKAREAADYIIRLRKKRAYAILDPSDPVPEDGKGYEAFIKEAQRLDKEYMALFIGKQFTTEEEFSFIYIPGSGNVKNELLFRFSADKGVLPKTDISGKPILISLTKEQDAFTSAEKLRESKHPDAGTKGIYYRVPVSATINITDGLQILYAGQAIVPQLGVVVPIPENLLNGAYQIQFNTQTGSIENVTEKE